MYWIVFAFFTSCETFTDVMLSWLPFYYEMKVVVVLWVLSPATEGSSVLYRNFVHPLLGRHEKVITIAFDARIRDDKRSHTDSVSVHPFAGDR